jgi:tetratricopeptide (TPR) repeat protein
MPPSQATIPGREFRLLIQGLQEWCATRPGEPFRGSLGLLRGEAGSGKSRLLTALNGALSTLGIRSRHASCFKEQLPLEVVRDLASGLLREVVEGRAAGGSAVPGLSMKNLAPFAPELHRLLPELSWGAPIGPFPSLSPELDRIRICDILARTFAEVSRGAPLVLLIEDLQWIDPLSRDVLRALLTIARHRAAHPLPPRILVVATLRSGEKAEEGLEQILDSRFRAFDVEVRGFSREDVRDCAESAGVDLPLTLREALHRGTAGNALQIRFFLSGFQPGDDPILSGLIDDPARAAEAFERAVLSRLWDLDEKEIEVVRLLAVLGRPVPARFVEELIATALPGSPAGRTAAAPSAPGSSAPGEDSILSRLIRLGWLRQDVLEDDARTLGIAGEPVAAIVAGSLSGREKTHAHRVLAEALLDWIARAPAPHLSGFGLTPFSRVFHHLTEVAGHPRLFEVGLSAAREMEGLSASPQAIEVYERLVERLDKQDGRRLTVCERLVEHLEQAGAHSEAIEIARSILESSAKDRGPEERARLLRRIGSLHGRLGEVKAQVECYAEGLSVLGGSPESLERLKLYAHLARIFLEKGDLSESSRYIEESLKLAGHPELTRDKEYLEIYSLAEEVNFRRGEYVEALAFEEKVFHHAEETKDWLQAMRSAGRLGHLCFLRGDPQRARQHLDAALERAAASGNRYLEARFLSRIGRLLRSRGDTGEAIDVLGRAQDIYEELSSVEEVTGLQRSLVHLHLVLYDVPRAAAILRDYSSRPLHPTADREEPAIFPLVYPDREGRSRAIADHRAALSAPPAGENSEERAMLSVELAELLLDEGKSAEAAGVFDAMVRGSWAPRSPAALGLILQRAGRIHRRLGDRAKALFWMEKSLEQLGAERLDQGPEKALLGNAYLEVGSINLIQGEGGKAYDHLLRGLRLFVDIESDQGFVATILRLAEFFREVGLWKEAEVFAGAVVDLCQGTSLARWQARASLLRGSLASRSGDFLESQKCFRRARAILSAMDLPGEKAWLELEAGWESYRREQYPEALRLARQGIESSREMGMKDLLDECILLLGTVESALANKKKNFLRAIELINQALLGAEQRGRPFFEARVLRSISIIHEDRGKDELAREYRTRADSILESLIARLPPEIRAGAQFSWQDRVALKIVESR